MKKAFVTGCYDIVHVGHLELFKFCKSMADWLVVGLDTDERVKESKGPERPINSLDARMKFLQAIKYVDEIFVFGSDEELIQNLVESKPKSALNRTSKVELFNSIFSDPNLIQDPLLINKLAKELNNQGLYLGKDSLNNARSVIGKIIKRAKAGELNPKAVENYKRIATEGKGEGAKMSHPYLRDIEVQAKSQATRKIQKIAEGRTREFDQYQDDEIIPLTLVDKMRKGYTWDKIAQTLPDSPEKERIKALIQQIKDMNPKGTLHADHFIEYQSGGQNTPLNIIAKTETGHYGQMQTKEFNKILEKIKKKNPGISQLKAKEKAMIEYIKKGYFLSKTSFVKKINKLNQKIIKAWNDPSSNYAKESISNRTHPLVKQKDALYNSQIDKQGGTGHLFDAKTPGVFRKKGDDVIFYPDKLDPELQEILTVNNSYYGAGKSEFGKFANTEEHMIDQLTGVRDSLQEAISTGFKDVESYKKFIEGYQTKYAKYNPRAKKAKVGLSMAHGGIASISHLTRPI